MKEKTKRIITAICFVLVVVLVLGLRNRIVDTIFVIVLSIVGMHEFNDAFKSKGYNPIAWIGYLGCLAIGLMGGVIPEDLKILILRMVLPAIVIVSFIYAMFKNEKYNIIDLTITILSLIYVPFMFSFLKLLMLMEHGRIWVLFAILGATITDTSAYEIGCKFGKRKLFKKISHISPKKTMEGAIAGIIGAVLSYVILTYISNSFFGMNINYMFIILMGIVASICGQFGDLSASFIKRYCGIKDFGTIMPGHGGILDRFDSLLFAAPVIYWFIKLYMLGM